MPGFINLQPQKRVRHNFFAPGMILHGDIISSKRIWYQGEIMEILTHTGQVLVITNTTVLLTQKGYKKAEEIGLGDTLLRYEGQLQNINYRHPAHLPNSAENIYSTHKLKREAIRQKLFENVSKVRYGNMKLFTNLIQQYDAIEKEGISIIKQHKWDGFVYSVTTTDNLMIANGIVTLSE